MLGIVQAQHHSMPSSTPTKRFLSNSGQAQASASTTQCSSGTASPIDHEIEHSSIGRCSSINVVNISDDENHSSVAKRSPYQDDDDGNDDDDDQKATRRMSALSTGTNWGWFEDVHDLGGGMASFPAKHANSTSPTSRSNVGGSLSGDGESKDGEIGADFNPQDDADGRRGRGNGNGDGDNGKKETKKKRGGLLQFTHSTVRPLNDIVSSDHNYDDYGTGGSFPPQMSPLYSRKGTVCTFPNYVLGASISTQKLWKTTAGTRPPQPVEERAFYEQLWAENFLRSEVNYSVPVNELITSSPLATMGLDGVADACDTGVEDSTDYNFAGRFVQNAGLFAAGAGVDAVEEAALIQRAAKARRAAAIDRDAGFVKSPECNRGGKKLHGRDQSSDGALAVLIKGDNPSGTTVSKSFARLVRGHQRRIDTISISIASYRVVQSRKHGKYAQFLVVYREGSFSDTVGVWKRYTDFDALSRKVTAGLSAAGVGGHGCSGLFSVIHPFCVEEETYDEILPNAVTSWKLLKKRQRWYRCLDVQYLAIKVFLLERFLHDILFECTDPKILRDFIGVDLLQ